VELLERYFLELWQIAIELSPPLLGGLILAGLIHLLLPAGFIHRTLSQRGAGSVFKSVLVGVPLPLCSCGVVPTALSLRKEGASNGATTSFLISTPQTGVDSILVSASFLGWPFAIFKVVTAFVTGMIGGIVAEHAEKPSLIAGNHPEVFEKTPRTLHEFWHYSVVELYGAIDKWIYVGVLLAALITALTPDNYFADMSIAQGISGILLMLAISVPLYVCATGSVPIAASLVAAGMPLGAALVFLMAGPATNVATIGAVYRTLGLRLLAVYLLTIIISSIAFALIFETMFPEQVIVTMHQHSSNQLGMVCLIILTAVSVWLFRYRWRQKRLLATASERNNMGTTLNVTGMSCQHCVAAVKKSLEAVEGVSDAVPDLDTGRVIIHGDHVDDAAIKQAVLDAGYGIKE
jgi:hypothetical protein